LLKGLDIPSTWTVARLGDIARVTSGGTPSRKVAGYWNGDVPWVSTGLIDFNTIRRTSEHITQLGVKNSSAKVFPKGTVLMAMFGQGVTRGKVARLGMRAAFNQACVAIIPHNRLPREYVFQYLWHHYKSIRALSNSGSQANLNAALIKSISIATPPPEEVNEIIRVARAWDRATLRTSRLLKLKRRLKRGLMQQLLTGRRRFPEFEAQPWREVHIGDILREEARTVKLDPNAPYRLVSIRRRSGGFFDREIRLGCQIGYSALEQLRAGDFVIARRQVLHGAMATVPTEFDGAYVSNAYAILVPLDGAAIHLPFFNYMSQQPRLYYLAFRCSYGVAIEKMFFRLDWFLKERITIPPTIAEQQKITAVLAAADREIDLLEQQLSALREQKKGLMQKLLTGGARVRLAAEESNHA
jgi:type I restriction enzyme, S subunit